MKIIFCKIFLLVCVVSLFASCEKEENDRPLGVALEDLLEDNYWEETVCFLYRNKGSDEILVTTDIISVCLVVGMQTMPNQVLLQKIYVEPDTRRVWRYYKGATSKGEPPCLCSRNEYVIEYKEHEAVVRITSPKAELTEKGAVTDSDMKVVSWNETQLVFHAPIKPFVFTNWQLATCTPDCEYIGLQITWRKTYPDNFMRNATPID